MEDGVVEASVLSSARKLAEKLEFRTICRFFEKISQVSARHAKIACLENFFDLLGKMFYGVESLQPSKNNSCRAFLLYVLRFLLPQFDRLRPSYGLRESQLGKVYIAALGLPIGGSEATNLNYYASTRTHHFSDVVHDILVKRSNCHTSLSTLKVNNLLNDLALSEKLQEKTRVIRAFIRETSPLEQKWLIRLITQHKLTLGLSPTHILRLLHPLADKLFNLSPSLDALCARLSALPETADEYTCAEDLFIKVSLNTAFSPMLCERTNSVHGLLDRLIQDNNDCDYVFAEVKLDGERVQLHKEGSQFRFWSRTGLEWTKSYGSNSSNGTLTPHLLSAFPDSIRNCVLDGEMLGFDPVSKVFHPKTHPHDVKTPRKPDFLQCDRPSQPILPCFVTFDILFFNGKCLTDQTCEERKRVLFSMFGFLPNESDILPNRPKRVNNSNLFVAGFAKVSPSSDSLDHVFQQILHREEEGLVVKLPRSVYQPGQRRAVGWYKLKPDYVDGLVTDLDCLIVGGYLNEWQKRSLKPKACTSIMSQFLCAVKSDEASGHFSSFCCVSVGFTRAEKCEVNNLLREHWIPYKTTDWLAVTSEKPDFLIEPRYSLVLQLRGAELVATSSFAARFTLRFPRVVAVRKNKSCDDCLTLPELTEINVATKGSHIFLPALFIWANIFWFEWVRMTTAIGCVARTSMAKLGINHGNEMIDEQFAVLVSIKGKLVRGGAAKSDSNQTEDEVVGDVGKTYPVVSPGDYGGSQAHCSKRRIAGGSLCPPSQKFRRSVSSLGREKAAQLPIAWKLFAGREFCFLLTGSSAHKADQLECSLAEFDVRLTKNPGPKTDFLVADKLTVRVKSYLTASQNGPAKRVDAVFDILKPDWFLQCDRDVQLSDFWFTKDSTANALRMPTPKNLP